MFKETEIIKQPLYITRIENGDILLVYDGYAKSTDDKKYKCVCREENDMLYIEGWEQLIVEIA